MLYQENAFKCRQLDMDLGCFYEISLEIKWDTFLAWARSSSTSNSNNVRPSTAHERGCCSVTSLQVEYLMKNVWWEHSTAGRILEFLNSSFEGGKRTSGAVQFRSSKYCDEINFTLTKRQRKRGRKRTLNDLNQYVHRKVKTQKKFYFPDFLGENFKYNFKDFPIWCWYLEVVV